MDFLYGVAPEKLVIFIFGAAFFGFYALISLLTGFVWFRFKRTYRDENPYSYWSMVSMHLLMVGFCLYPLLFCGD